MNVKTQGASRRYSRRVPMRVVIEIAKGCVQHIATDEPCEVLLIDRDELAEEMLPDGERGYVSLLDSPAEPEAVEESYKFAGLIPS